jgi:hypothetical protein
VKVLPANRGPVIIIFLLKYVSHVFCIFARFYALSVHVTDTDIDDILYFRVNLLKASYVGYRGSDDYYLYSLSFKVFL